MKLLPTKNPALLAIPAAAFCISAQAIDLLPRDLTTPAPGFQVVRVAQQVSEREDLYVSGNKVADLSGAGFTISQTQLRIGRSFTLAGMPALAYIQGGYGSAKPTGALTDPPFSTSLDIRGDQGTADLAALLAIWPYTDREKNQHLGLGVYFFAPTGGFDNNRLRPLNMSDNRYKAALQAGYQTPVFNKKLIWLVAGDVMWFEKDDDYKAVLSLGSSSPIFTQRQKPMIALQTALSYSVSDTAWIGVSYLYNHGAQTRLACDKAPGALNCNVLVTTLLGDQNGLQNDKVTTHRFMLSASAGTPIGRFALQYNRDIKLEYGFKEKNRFTASFVKFF
jgi:hypothetical protein